MIRTKTELLQRSHEVSEQITNLTKEQKELEEALIPFAIFHVGEVVQDSYNTKFRISRASCSVRRGGAYMSFWGFPKLKSGRWSDVQKSISGSVRMLDDPEDSDRVHLRCCTECGDEWLPNTFQQASDQQSFPAHTYNECPKGHSANRRRLTKFDRVAHDAEMNERVRRSLEAPDA